MGKHGGYGWKADQPDHRDIKLHSILKVAEGFDPEAPVSLKSNLPSVYDQGQIGSCTGNSTAGAIRTRCNILNYPWPYTPSRLMLYYNARQLEGTTFYDAGATIRDIFKALADTGVCPEDSNIAWSWPYSSTDLRYLMPPPPPCYEDAKLHKAVKYYSTPQSRQSIKQALSAGMPVVIGISVYESFESDAVKNTGIVPMPGQDEALLGGHALYVFGGDDEHKGYASVRNSWSESFGDKGNVYIPWEYLESADLAADFWTVDVVT